MGSKLLWMWVWVIFVFVSLDRRWSQGCLEQERLASKWNEDLGEWYLNASLFSPFQELQILSLYGNLIAGCIENESLRFMNNLEYLSLSGNTFNNSILSFLSALSPLKGLYIGDVGLKGTVDLSEISDSLSNLEELDLGYSQINKLVLTKGNNTSLRNLQVLTLSNVNIHDGSTLLQLLESLPSLKTLFLNYYNFSGIMSSDGNLLQSIAAFTSLETLNMWDCQLNGILGVKDFSNFKNLKDLFISSTDLNISFLHRLCELVHLQELDLSGNNLRGALPSCFANLTSLQVLDISFSPFSLEPFFNHSKLKSFACKYNNLYAETELHSLTPKFQLNSIILSGCKGSCTFPKFLYHQHDLKVVDLSHNNFTGDHFPNWLLENNTKLQLLFLANNSLTGPLQLPIHSYANLMTLDISMNTINGHILAEVGGNIPSSVDDMNSLKSLI
ncbi:hypothetical protein ACOSQ2_006668 [Xanthoceras sorbifolium]